MVTVMSNLSLQKKLGGGISPPPLVPTPINIELHCNCFIYFNVHNSHNCHYFERYNLCTPESDTDMFIVYQAKTKDILGFNPPKQTIKVSGEGVKNV